MSLAKPVMRGMLVRRTKILLSLSAAACFSIVVGVKVLLSNGRKLTYDAFYKDYDYDKEFNAMRETGVFEGVQPTGK